MWFWLLFSCKDFGFLPLQMIYMLGTETLEHTRKWKEDTFLITPSSCSEGFLGGCPPTPWHGLRARGLGFKHIHNQTTFEHSSVFHTERGQLWDNKKEQEAWVPGF